MAQIGFRVVWRCGVGSRGKDYGLFRGLEDFHGWDMLWKP